MGSSRERAVSKVDAATAAKERFLFATTRRLMAFQWALMIKGVVLTGFAVAMDWVFWMTLTDENDVDHKLTGMLNMFITLENGNFNTGLIPGQSFNSETLASASKNAIEQWQAYIADVYIVPTVPWYLILALCVLSSGLLMIDTLIGIVKPAWQHLSHLAVDPSYFRAIPFALAPASKYGRRANNAGRISALDHFLFEAHRASRDVLGILIVEVPFIVANVCVMHMSSGAVVYPHCECLSAADFAANACCSSTYLHEADMFTEATRSVQLDTCHALPDAPWHTLCETDKKEVPWSQYASLVMSIFGFVSTAYAWYSASYIRTGRCKWAFMAAVTYHHAQTRDKDRADVRWSSIESWLDEKTAKDVPLMLPRDAKKVGDETYWVPRKRGDRSGISSENTAKRNVVLREYFKDAMDTKLFRDLEARALAAQQPDVVTIAKAIMLSGAVEEADSFVDVEFAKKRFVEPTEKTPAIS